MIKPGTLCVIEPGRDSLEEEASQLYGLVVVASQLREELWDTVPTPTVTYAAATLSVDGIIWPKMVPVGLRLPEHWLIPINGNSRMDEAKSVEKAHA
jgi:hypothetical protein